MLKPSKSLVNALSLSTALICPLMNLPAIAVELVGRAVLPADTFAPGPTSGQLITGNTNDRTVPFVNKQPVQGFSAVLPSSKPGSFLVLADNGYGSKGNSPDFLLRFYAVSPDFKTASGGSGRVFPVNVRSGERLKSFLPQSFVQLNDQRSRAGFPIVAEERVYPGSITPTNPNGIPVAPTIKTNRLLSGADFDLESFRRTNDGTYWFGEEFGPFLLHASSAGQLIEAPIPLPNFLQLGNLPLVQSPDNPAFTNLPTDEARIAAANLPRSKGFEGLAINPSGTKLYAMLEGPLVSDSQRNRLLINEFDLVRKRYTGRTFSYRMENTIENGQAIGDLTAINDHEFIVIERDSRQGDPNNTAFTEPAQFKRLYKININQLDSAGFVRKELLVDLLNIPDPNSIGGNGTVNNRFTFPFVTIESVLPINPRILLVINDNNYPFSVGRTPNQPDNSEFILIRLDRPLDLAPALRIPHSSANNL